MNLVSLRGSIGDRDVHVAGTLFGKRAAPRIVGINEHSVDMPPSSHMLVVRNSDTPGMIGRVTTTLGDAEINIADMDVGTNAAGEAALMVLSTYSPVPLEIVERLRAIPGVFDAERHRPRLTGRRSRRSVAERVCEAELDEDRRALGLVGLGVDRTGRVLLAEDAELLHQVFGADRLDFLVAPGFAALASFRGAVLALPLALSLLKRFRSHVNQPQLVVRQSAPGSAS